MQIKIGLNLSRKTIRRNTNFWIKFLPFSDTKRQMDATFPLYLPRFLGHSHFQQSFNVFFFFFFFSSSLFANWPLSTSHSLPMQCIHWETRYFSPSIPSPHSLSIRLQLETSNLSGAKLRDTINFRRLMNTHLHFETKLKEESFCIRMQCLCFLYQSETTCIFFFFFLPENKTNETNEI